MGSDAMNGVRKAQSDLATSNAAAATPSSGGREEGIKGNGEETRAEKSLADLQDLSVEGIMGALRPCAANNEKYIQLMTKLSAHP